MDADTTMVNIYNILSKIGYPKITDGQSNNMETTILMGNDRTFLLSWILKEKCDLITSKLDRLNGELLEEKIFEYYSQSGLCNAKDILFGRCEMAEQLPFLRLLLSFIENVYDTSAENSSKTQTALESTFQVPTNTPSRNIDKKMNYLETKKYFQSIESNLILRNDANKQTIPKIAEKNPSLCIEDESKEFQQEHKVLVQNFNNSFSSLNTSMLEHPTNINSLNSEISSMAKNFANFKQTLDSKDVLLKFDVSKDIPETVTPLNTMIKDIMISLEEMKNKYLDNTWD